MHPFREVKNLCVGGGWLTIALLHVQKLCFCLYKQLSLIIDICNYWEIPKFTLFTFTMSHNFACFIVMRNKEKSMLICR